MNLCFILLLFTFVHCFKNLRYNKIKKYNIPKKDYDLLANKNNYVYDPMFNSYIYIDKDIRKIFNNQKIKK